MSEQELRDLDRWIAVNVFGWQQFREEEYPHRMLWREGDEGSPVWDYPDAYSDDPGAAMAVLEKCADKLEQTKDEMDCVQIQRGDGQWHVCGFESDIPVCTAETLPLAICLFSKKLYE